MLQMRIDRRCKNFTKPFRDTTREWTRSCRI